MKLSLYKVANEYLQACNRLLELQDEIPEQAIADTLEGLAGSIEQKSINVAAYYKNMQKEINALKEYEYEMRERRRRFEKCAERLKEYLKYNLERCGIQKVNGPEFDIAVCQTTGTVVVHDLARIPQEFIRRTEIHIDKSKIKCAVIRGEIVPGVHVEPGTFLKIK